MNIAALMIGRGGSSLEDKNILPVLGVPLLHWSAAAARRSRHIGRFYVSSDCPRILETAGRAGYAPIERPAELASATAQSSDAVRHAFAIMERDGPIDVLVVQHANVGTISTGQIDACIDLLLAHPEATSVVPAHQHPEYHPMRARRLRPDGSLEPGLEATVFYDPPGPADRLFLRPQLLGAARQDRRLRSAGTAALALHGLAYPAVRDRGLQRRARSRRSAEDRGLDRGKRHPAARLRLRSGARNLASRRQLKQQELLPNHGRNQTGRRQN